MAESDALLEKVSAWYESYAEVREEFDEWAEDPFGDTYDRDLGKKKRYPAPKRIAKLLLPKMQQKENIIDFACGTGLSGLPYFKKGHFVDGIDFSEVSLKKALEKGYRNVWNVNLVEDSYPTLEKYSAAICIGCIGQYIPLDFMIPRIVNALKEGSLVGITIEKSKSLVETEVVEELKKNQLIPFSIEEGLGYHIGLGKGDFLYIGAQVNGC